MAIRMVRAEDVEETALAVVDQEFTDYFGPNWRTWQPWQIEQYLDAMEQAHSEFDADSYREAA
ncbi:hypothetical protein ACN2WE_05465 [Streptomyces sp. cg28]|uniref:hypothetical protein n=1 Tax=Streptomyces sp. cg28 TaxID=3403457 RepID=UPI003B21CC23